MTTEPSPASPSWRWHASVLFGFALLAVAITWPLARPGAAVVPDMDDSFFNIWRLAWIAHQLVRDPTALFHANIFYPVEHTLAYSDALLLVGLVAAPFFWAGAAPWAVHNALLLAALTSSAWAGSLLALRLTGDRPAALLAGLIVGFAPYRLAHIAHLELQWLVWMPLALLALHRLTEGPTVRRGLALGACVAGQLLCSIYYGVFVSVFIGVAWLLLLLAHGVRPRLARATAAAAIPLVLVAVPYLSPYAASRHAHPPRSAHEISVYSATPGDYARVPPFNALRGREGFAPEERSLYPGAAVLALTLIALWPRRSSGDADAARVRTTWVYAVLALLAADASFGSNGVTFPVLQATVPPLANLRAPARFASLGLVTLAMLAAFGAARLRARIASPAVRAGVVALAAAVCLVEYWSRLPVRDASLQPTAVDAWLRTLPDDTVILELPVPHVHSLWLFEATHEVRSIHHWRRMLNGYSGFVPTIYGNTLNALQTFPDAPSVARLQRLSVDYVVLRRANLDDGAYARLAGTLLTTPTFGRPLVFGRGDEEAVVFPLAPAP